MFALCIEFLTGRYVAKETHDRAEWPPHPVRLFSAFVSALYTPSPAEFTGERAALEWLQKQGAPEIAFSPEAIRRAVVTMYVPVNDLGLPSESAEVLQKALDDALAGKTKQGARAKTDPVTAARKRLREAGKQALALLPERTGARKKRTFPTVAPSNPVVYFVWPSADASPHRGPLERLLSRVSYLGHSSSLVAIGLAENGWPEKRWVPGGRGIKLRCFSTNQIKDLDQIYSSNERMAQSYRLPCEIVSYGIPRDETVEGGSVFSRDWIVFRKTRGPDLSLLAALDLTQALRRAVVRRAEIAQVSSRALELLTGKDANGAILRENHVVWLALPFVGRRGARGLAECKGLAVVLPAFLDQPAHARLADEILRILDFDSPLPIGELGTWQMERIVDSQDGASLSSLTWTRPSKRWSTVTPIVLDRHPGHLFGRAARTEAQLAAKERAKQEAEASVIAACRRNGLPEPFEVSLSRFSSVVGVPPSHQFRPPLRGHQARRWHIHATLRFSETVAGPVLLGAGRYFGYGLCRPIADEFYGEGI
jgi:CRISPR-associated protein Csb2